jgi:hypothetical protein
VAQGGFSIICVPEATLALDIHRSRLWVTVGNIAGEARVSLLPIDVARRRQSRRAVISSTRANATP